MTFRWWTCCLISALSDHLQQPTSPSKWEMALSSPICWDSTWTCPDYRLFSILGWPTVENLPWPGVYTSRYPTAASLHRIHILRLCLVVQVVLVLLLTNVPVMVSDDRRWFSFHRMILLYQWTAVDLNNMTVRAFFEY